MLVSKTVKIKLNSRNIKYYEKLGYDIPKHKDKYGRIKVNIGDELEVKIEHLSKGSHSIVQWQCDGENCDKVMTGTYQKYLKYIKKDGKIYCQKCATKLFASSKQIKTKLKKSKSFEQYCIETNRQDLLDRWDYEKNDCKPSEVSYSSAKLIWFKCDKHPEHHSELKSLNRFANGQEGSITCNQCNSVAQSIIDLYGEENLYKIWNKELNGNLNPWNISSCSHIEVWFNCLDDKHESYLRSCKSSTRLEYRCPKCYFPSKGEFNITNILDKYDINFETQHSFNGCRSIQPLPFDFYLPDHNTLIEFDGEQHYRPASIFGGLNEFIGQKVRDTIKDVYCKNNNIKLIRIPYWYLDDIEIILINELNINIQKSNIN